jgi:hypothetical protein
VHCIYLATATHSISTRACFGRVLTAKAARAGGCSPVKSMQSRENEGTKTNERLQKQIVGQREDNWRLDSGHATVTNVVGVSYNYTRIEDSQYVHLL